MMRRVPELDALRALAAGVVLLFHLHPPTFVFGWTGVDLFFVLSGYLITTIILDHLGTPRFVRNFYVRRGLRIWPIYYLLLGVLLLTAPLLPPDRRQPDAGLLYYLTYTQNVPFYDFRPMPKFHEGFDHSWTLALEEQFYLLWPALLALACWSGWDRIAASVGRRLKADWGGRWRERWRRRPVWLRPRDGREGRLIAVCLAAVALAWMAREGGYLRLGRYPERILIARCDGFALGGLLAVLLIDRDRVERNLGRFRLAFGGMLALTLAVVLGNMTAKGAIGYLGLPTPGDPAGTILMISLLYFSLVGAVVCFAGHPALAPLRWRPLCYLGLISYGIYLYHYPIYWAFDGFAVKYEVSAWRGLWKFVATLVVAVASWHLIERPILGLKDRFAYGPIRPGPGEPRESAAVELRNDPIMAEAGRPPAGPTGR
jgi:peptidoglycan/LPS O-acetylase OafA/YrhL